MCCEKEPQLWPSPKGMRYLAYCYLYGLGGAPVDKLQADYWLEQSANNKDMTAMELYNLNKSR